MTQPGQEVDHPRDANQLDALLLQPLQVQPVGIVLLVGDSEYQVVDYVAKRVVQGGLRVQFRPTTLLRLRLVKLKEKM